MRKSPRQLSRIASVVLAAGLALSACGGDDDDNDAGSTPGDGPSVNLVKDGKITTCTNLPYPPFQYEEGGDVVGFDVDLIDLVADELGVEQEILDISFDSIKGGAALNAGSCDVAAAGMTITADRAENLDFSAPYFDEVLGLLVAKDSGVTSLDDVKADELSLGVQSGTTSLDFAKANGLEPREFEDSGLQIIALQTEQVDVVLQDLPVVNEWLENPEIAEKFELAAQVETDAQYGFAVEKDGNPELLKLINDTLARAIEDGTWARLYEVWMGSTPESTPEAQQ